LFDAIGSDACSFVDGSIIKSVHLIRCEGSVHLKHGSFKTYLGNKEDDIPYTIAKLKYGVDYPDFPILKEPCVEYPAVKQWDVTEIVSKLEAQTKIRKDTTKQVNVLDYFRTEGDNHCPWIENLFLTKYTDNRKKIIGLVFIPYLKIIKHNTKLMTKKLIEEWLRNVCDLWDDDVNKYMAYVDANWDRVTIKPLKYETFKAIITDTSQNTTPQTEKKTTNVGEQKCLK
jgi:hypothetical protein